MHKPINNEAVSAKVESNKRDDAQRLYHALRAGLTVEIVVGCNASGTAALSGEVDGGHFYFTIDDTVAKRALFFARNIHHASARDGLARIALDVWNPQGKAYRVANGYP